MCCFLQKHTLSHEFYFRVLADTRRLMSNLISHKTLTVTRRVELHSNTLSRRDCCNTSRLCHTHNTWHCRSRISVTCFVQKLRNLGSLSRTRFTTHNHDIILIHSFHKFLLHTTHWQFHTYGLNLRITTHESEKFSRTILFDLLITGRRIYHTSSFQEFVGKIHIPMFLTFWIERCATMCTVLWSFRVRTYREGFLTHTTQKCVTIQRRI